MTAVRFASSESSDAAFQRNLRTARLVDLGSLMPRKADRFIPRSRTRGRAVARLPGRQVARPQGTGDGALRRRLGEQGGDPLCCVYRGMPLPYIHMHSANSPDRPSYSDDSLRCHLVSHHSFNKPSPLCYFSAQHGQPVQHDFRLSQRVYRPGSRAEELLRPEDDAAGVEGGVGFCASIDHW